MRADRWRGPVLWRLGPPLIVALLLLPLGAGLCFLLLNALGGSDTAESAWQDLLAAPGLGQATLLSLWTGLAASLLSLALALLLLAACGEGLSRWLARSVPPLVAVPHLALAVGFAFLIAPSGWIARLLSPWATGWERPPDLLLLNDPAGLALILGLVLKETPFLLLIGLAALANDEAAARLRVARSLGQPPLAAWFKVVAPALYPQLRWPLYAVLAYGLGNVEMALVLGPTTPPTLAVLLLGWFRDPTLALWPQAAAGALAQVLLVAAVVLLWRGGERLAGRLGRRWIARGGRGGGAAAWRMIGLGAGGLVLLLGLLSLLLLALWSLAAQWRFPAALPDAWSLAVWQRHAPTLLGSLATTAGLGLATTAIALLLTLLALEHEQASGRRAGTGARLLLHLPLLAPPVALAFGWTAALAHAGLIGGWLAVIWTHLVYVLPYVFLALAGAWARLDPRLVHSARALGKGPLTVLWRVKLPLLRGPLLAAAAIGLAVSVALYLPTLAPGGGRVVTLATETLALAGGGDRRLTATLALLQALLPLLAFWLALTLGRPRRFRSSRR